MEYIFIGFMSAMGWWGANHYVIIPYFPPDPPSRAEREAEEKKAKLESLKEAKKDDGTKEKNVD